MRIILGLIVLLAALLNVGCVDGGVMLQESVQGEWSNFHNQAHKLSQDVQTPAEKPTAEK